jgi:hypothetical protein
MCWGSQSVRARTAALLRLRQLYGLDERRLVPAVLRAWNHDPPGLVAPEVFHRGDEPELYRHETLAGGVGAEPV